MIMLIQSTYTFYMLQFKNWPSRITNYTCILTSLRAVQLPNLPPSALLISILLNLFHKIKSPILP